MLAAKTENGSGWSEKGRVTSGTALALKGRLMLLWCSPSTVQTMKNRWKTVYETDEVRFGAYQQVRVIITCILPMTMYVFVRAEDKSNYGGINWCCRYLRLMYQVMVSIIRRTTTGSVRFVRLIQVVAVRMLLRC